MENQYQLNPNCKACVCHQSAGRKSVCLRGRTESNGKKRLAVFTDSPDYFADSSGRGYTLDVRRMLDWLFARMSIEHGRVAYEYTLRCYTKGTLPNTKADRAVCIEECSTYRFASIAKLQPKAIAVLGQVSLEAFTGKSQIGQWVERRIRSWEPVIRDFADGVWVGYSIQYILTSPGDTPSVFRVLWKAAEEAGLKPKIDPTVPPFCWRNLNH